MKYLFGFVAVVLISVRAAVAQEVVIPDPALNAAIREALRRPTGPLTQQDMLSLTNLSAGGRNISSAEGLQAARNLQILDLDGNSITNFSIANALTNLTILDLFNNHLASFVLSNGLPRLTILDIGFNSLTRCSLPAGLRSLDTLFLENNSLTNFNLPAGLTSLKQLDVSANRLASFSPPADMTNVVTLLLFANQLTNVTLSGNLHQLSHLDLDFNRLRSFTAPVGLTNLISLALLGNQLTNVTLASDMLQLGSIDLGANQLSRFTLPPGLSRLTFLRLNGNRLTSLALPPGMTNLTGLSLSENQLTNLTLPSDLIRLAQLDLGQNNLAHFTFGSGMTNLSSVDLNANQLTELTLPPDLINLTSLFVDANPLMTFVLSETMEAGNLAGLVALLHTRAVNVFSYPLTVQLFRLRQPIGAFQFAIKGPPGNYAVLASTNLVAWSAVRSVSNGVGTVVFTDGEAHLFPRKFYRAVLQTPPANMVFVAPDTFMMGSPANEQDRSVDEGPQTQVTLTRGYWIGKYEVTQGEYLSLMNTNPSDFPGDLSRPVSGVTWGDATNYCAKLTERDVAAGRIPMGSRYRLPTEAEWECAARAGTTTRFSYGDDPAYGSVTNYAWFLDFAILDLIVHPVGQKLPNAWGLYDVHGNVWEWCQDNYGTLPGGTQIDPIGPNSTLFRDKVMRGGAYDYPNSSCRSASRSFRFPLWPDSDAGFRVVLVTNP